MLPIHPAESSPWLELFADVTDKSYSPKDTGELNGEQDGLKFFKLIEDYKNFQDDYAKEIEFDIEQQYFGRFIWFLIIIPKHNLIFIKIGVEHTEI